jgi:NDP-sugar pyrophosphorylase family protein
MNGGVYFFKKKIFRFIKNKFMSLENDILINLIKENKINGIYSNNFFHDIGIKKFFDKTNQLINDKLTRPAAFLDRDGVLILIKNIFSK